MATATKTKTKTKPKAKVNPKAKAKLPEKKAGASAKKKPEVRTAKEKQAEMAKSEVRWNESRTALLKALQKLKAFSASAARSAEDLAKVSKLDVQKVKLHCDQYRGTELVAKGIVICNRVEGQRALSYHLTAKGKKTKLS